MKIYKTIAPDDPHAKIQYFSEYIVSREASNRNKFSQSMTVFSSSSNIVPPQHHSESSTFNIIKSPESRISNYSPQINQCNTNSIPNSMHTSLYGDATSRASSKQRLNNWLEQENRIDEIDKYPNEIDAFCTYELKSFIHSSAEIGSLRDKVEFSEWSGSARGGDFEQQPGEMFGILQESSLAAQSVCKYDKSQYTVSQVSISNKNDDCFSEISDPSDLDSIIFKPIEKLPTLQ